VSFIKRLGIGKPKSDPEHPRATSGGASGALKYVLNPTLVPPEPVDYGGHRGEVETFIASLALMNPDEVAMVHKQGLASGAHMSPRWAEVEGHVVAAASIHGLELGRIAAQRRASNASAAGQGRADNRWVVTDFCAGVWAEVLVLRDFLPMEIRAIAFEPWQDVLQAPDWLAER
jgi:hypothetical protein